MKLTFYLFSLALLVFQTSIRVDVNLQQVRFRLTDGANKAVPTLRPEDFVVEENGVGQKIEALTHHSDTPVSFAIVIKSMDRFRSLSEGWTGADVAQTVVNEIFRQMRPQDDLLLFSDTDSAPLVTLQGVAGRAKEVEDTVRRISPASPQTPPLDMRVTLTKALIALKASRHPSRVLITIGMIPWDVGVAPDSLARATANEAEIPIYCIDINGDHRGYPYDNGNLLDPSRLGWTFNMERNYEFWVNPFTEQTGGRSFRFDLNSLHSARDLSRLNGFITQMNLDLRAYYVLGYYSPVPPGTTRRIRLQPVAPDHRASILRTPMQSLTDTTPPGAAILSRSARVLSSEIVFGSAEFIQILQGEFLMGCGQTDPSCYPTDYGFVSPVVPTPNSRRLDPWRVRISKAFDIGKFEVTQAQWENVMGANPSYFRGANRPVERVSWREVQEFLKKMNARRDGYRYRLPTEEEWEYVARAGKSGHHEGSLDAVAWYVENAEGQTHPRGTKEPNAWGVHDMYGNVFEWIQDSNVDIPRDFSGGALGSGASTRRIRGGSWYSSAVFSRTSYRMGLTENSRLSTIGFRMVREKQ